MHKFRSDDPKDKLLIAKTYCETYIKEYNLSKQRVEELEKIYEVSPSKEVKEKIVRIKDHMNDLKGNINKLNDEMKRLKIQFN